MDAILILLLLGVLGLAMLADFVCWIVIVVKMFKDADTGTGVFGLLCGIYAFYWGWSNSSWDPFLRTVMWIWTASLAATIALRVAMEFLASS